MKIAIVVSMISVHRDYFKEREILQNVHCVNKRHGRVRISWVKGLREVINLVVSRMGMVMRDDEEYFQNFARKFGMS